MNTTLWFRRLALAGVLLGLVVVVLGAYVRLTAAGLGCPDWPGCYGHVTPLGAASHASELGAAFPRSPLDVGKAWREMIHRYAASTLGLIIVLITALALATRRQRLVPVGFALALLGTVVFQGALGMLTVTWQLKPLIVTSHLVFGLTTVALLWWLRLSLPAGAPVATRVPVPQAPTAVPAVAAARQLAVAGLAALVVQIVLGGWTSSNYAAVACPDFPTCQNQWLPAMDYRDAFVLWRGLGVNYEGGVLANPARIAIHFTHRLGAIVATLALLLAAGLTLARTGGAAGAAGAADSLAPARRAAVAVLAALGLQLALGIFMVLRGFPLPLATAHNAGAALLVLAVVALNRRLRPVGPGDADSANLRVPALAPAPRAAPP